MKTISKYSLLNLSQHAKRQLHYFFSHQGFDLSAARRKNATRETTGPLKAWLNAHRKNPYPTKGEKVMLAIITRMTLTQVSTWFANARRRLKKDNTYGENDYDSDGRFTHFIHFWVDILMLILYKSSHKSQNFLKI